MAGLFDKIFGRWKKPPQGRYQGGYRMLTGREASFRSFDAHIYEAQLVRECIDAIARHVAKLQPVFNGSAQPVTVNALKKTPNSLYTWSQMLYRCATILYAETNLIIVPILNQKGETVGLWPLLPSRCEVVAYGGEPWLRYKFHWGEWAAIELNRVGILTRFQYEDDLKGSGNEALRPTLDLISIENQGIKAGVKNGAAYRFMAKLINWSSDEDLANERKRFSELNFSADAEAGGVLLWPNTMEDVKQLDAKPFVADAETLKVIRDGCFEYFGVNEAILKNEAYGDAWSAFYEGCIEWFSVQFSDVICSMLFSSRERSQGAEFMLTSNRLQYMTNNDKLQVSAQMMDRGLMTRNEIRQIWNLPPVNDGDQMLIRAEYVNMTERTENEND